MEHKKIKIKNKSESKNEKQIAPVPRKTKST